MTRGTRTGGRGLLCLLNLTVVPLPTRRLATNDSVPQGLYSTLGHAIYQVATLGRSMRIRFFAIAICAGLLPVLFGGVLEGGAVASPPSIESESVSNVTPTNATLEAEIDPQGAANGVFYQFQLLLDPGEAPTELACPPSPPPGYSTCIGPQSSDVLPIGFVSGTGSHLITLELSSAAVSLEPGRTYYFRLLAAPAKQTEDSVEWEPPAVGGQSEGFTTPNRPSILGEAVSNVTEHDAMLEAQIDPHEAGAYYQFQLVADASEYASEILCPEPPFQGPSQPCIGTHAGGVLPIASVGGEAGSVSLDLSSAGVRLQPATTYHYRVLTARAIQTEDTIEWEEPSVVGADRTFTTSSEAPSTGGGSGSVPPLDGPIWTGVGQHNAYGHCRKQKRHLRHRHRAHGSHLRPCGPRRPSL